MPKREYVVVSTSTGPLPNEVEKAPWRGGEAPGDDDAENEPASDVNEFEKGALGLGRSQFDLAASRSVTSAAL